MSRSHLNEMKEIKLKVIRKVKPNGPPRDFTGITRDGWVVGDNLGCGDLEEDCRVVLDGQVEFIKAVRKKHGLSQKELGWILGLSRPTAGAVTHGERELTLREYILLNNIILLDDEK